jgi:hypothetical protein
MESTFLNVKLYSSVLMYKYCNKYNIEYPEITFNRQEFFENISNSVSETTIFDYKSPNRVINGIALVKNYIKYLQEATLEDCGDILLKVLTYIKNVEFPKYCFAKVPKDHIKMGVTLPDEVICFYQIVYQQIHNGRWIDVPLERICQAILPPTEPYIVLESPKKANNYNEWPVDVEIDNLLQEDIFAQKSKLKDIMTADIASDEVVLGAVMYTYSHKKEVVTMLTSRFISRGDFLSKVSSDYTFNGRIYMFDYIDRYEPFQSYNLTFFNGGTVSFVNQSLFCYPSSLWSEVFHWKPVLDNKIRWFNADDEEVVRFEYLYGKNSWSNNSINFYQPVMQRWIGKKSEIEKIEQRHRVNLKCCVEVQEFDV